MPDNFKKIFYSFLFWRISLFCVAFLSTILIKDFGARFPYYHELLISTGLPNWIWGFGNFDGVHYLTIARNGYSAQFTQSFFPLYPLMIRFITFNNFFFITGLILSSTFFLGALFLLNKLYCLDYKKDLSYKSILFLLFFPTAFYFSAIYSESLFLLLAVGCLLAIRKNKIILAGFLAGFASATRVVGIFLFLALAIEVLNSKSKDNFKKIIGLMLAPLGLILYMVFLQIHYQDSLYFLHALPSFGTGRSDQPFILLPQVIFRYFKILTSVQSNSLAFFNSTLELIFTLLPLTAIIFLFKKIRLSYFIFTLGCLILPTLTGTLTSMPRYVLISFLIFPRVILGLGKLEKPVFVVMFIFQIILLSLFVRGYWVA